MPKKNEAIHGRSRDSSPGTNRVKTIFTSTASTPPASTPPIAPSTVLFGLIAGASLRRPYARPTKYAPASEQTTAVRQKIM